MPVNVRIIVATQQTTFLRYSRLAVSDAVQGGLRVDESLLTQSGFDLYLSIDLRLRSPFITQVASQVWLARLLPAFTPFGLDTFAHVFVDYLAFGFWVNVHHVGFWWRQVLNKVLVHRRRELRRASLTVKWASEIEQCCRVLRHLLALLD